MLYTDQDLEAIARATHEANRAWCLLHGDESQVPWDDAPEWQRRSALAGVLGVLQGNGPEESHASWLEEKSAAGWVYGPEKDAEKKTHPCMVPYDALSDEQRAKDAIFVGVARAMLDALDFARDPLTRFGHDAQAEEFDALSEKFLYDLTETPGSTLFLACPVASVESEGEFDYVVCQRIGGRMSKAMAEGVIIECVRAMADPKTLQDLGKVDGLNAMSNKLSDLQATERAAKLARPEPESSH